MSIYEYDEEKTMRQMKEEGREEGEEVFAALTKVLLKDGRTEDLLQAAADKTLREKLYVEYHLKKED